MAFKTFKTSREAINLRALGDRIAAIRCSIGDVDVPRNSGIRRSESKRHLLENIAERGGSW